MFVKEVWRCANVHRWVW